MTLPRITAAELASRLNATPSKTGKGWMAICPAHNDTTPSLSIDEGADGKVLLHCFGLCTYDAVSAALRSKFNIEQIQLYALKERRRPISDAKVIVATYDYVNANNELVFQVKRYDPKDFRQCRPDGKGGTIWNTKGIIKPLYRLPKVIEAIAKGERLYIVEGEKDVHSLESLGQYATCNAGGAGKWTESYTAALQGADLVIIADRDEPGRRGAQAVRNAVAAMAKSVKVIELPDRAGHSVKDASDWIKAGGTLDELEAIVQNAPEAPEAPEQDAGADAKEANKYPFRNYRDIEREINGKIKLEKEPRALEAMIDDIHRRFLNFPRVMVSQLFYHNQGSSDIEVIHGQAPLISWIGLKSKHRVDWMRGTGMFTKDEFFESLKMTGRKYQGVSNVPSWPKREDIYYTHGDLPQPSDGYSTFWRFVDYFVPADEENRRLVAAFIIAPIFFKHGVQRPAWVIDSDSGPGTGKSKLVELIAELYSCPVIRTHKQELRQNVSELHKRLLSTSGRKARIVLVDNITGTFQSPELADMITAHHISGKPAYGRGEESRQNDLTYAITANSASLSNDIADRSFCITLTKPKRVSGWVTEVTEFITCNRMQVFADIIAMLEQHTPFEGIEPTTRMPMFEEFILQAVCSDIDQYKSVLQTLDRGKLEANAEEEEAAEIRETIIQRLSDMEINPRAQDVFIHSTVLDIWLEPVTKERRKIGVVRNLAQMGKLKNFDQKVKQFPHSGDNRRSGAAWIADQNAGQTFNPVFIVMTNGTQIMKKLCRDYSGIIPKQRRAPEPEIEPEEIDLSFLD